MGVYPPLKWLAAGLATMLMTACGSTSSLPPPAKLQALDEPLPVRSLWTTRVGGVADQYLRLPVLVRGEVGYSVDYQGRLRIVDLADGSLRRRVETGLDVTAGPAWANGSLLVGTRQGAVVALDAETGEPRWRSQLSSEILASPAVAGDTAVVRAVDGRIYALDVRSGERRWVYERSTPALTLRGTSAPLIVNDLVIAGLDNGRLVALALRNGTVFWEVPIAVPVGRTELERMIDIDADPVVYEDIVYAVSYQGRLAAVDLASGRMLWARDMSSYNGFVVDAYRIYLTDADDQVWALNRQNGATLWRQDQLLNRSLTRPTLFGAHVLVGDYNGYLHWLSREDGRLVGRSRINEAFFDFKQDYDEDDLTFRKTYNVLVPPVVAEDRVLVLDRQGSLAAFKLWQQ